MGDDAVFLEGVDPDGNPHAAVENQAAALFSTVHGAGRVMSRNAARGRRKKVQGKWVADPAHPGAVSRQDMERWIKKREVTLRGADTDEAPQAYKRLPDVLSHHAGTVRILHTLSPSASRWRGPASSTLTRTDRRVGRPGVGAGLPRAGSRAERRSTDRASQSPNVIP